MISLSSRTLVSLPVLLLLGCSTAVFAQSGLGATSHCGDAILQRSEGEQCDDGKWNSDVTPNACRTNCQLPHCGDGVIDASEQCDNGPRNSDTRPNTCRTDCKLPFCGDGVKDTNEECDHGAAHNGHDGSCDAECHRMAPAAAAQQTSPSPPAPAASHNPAIDVKPAPPPMQYSLLSYAIPAAVVVTVLLLVYAGIVTRQSLAASRGKKKKISSIDDLPLDQIEMPWHTW